MALAMLFTLYPILYTFYISVTNMGSGHLMSKQQAITRLEKQLYLPEGGEIYSWTAFQSKDGDYALWLMPEEGPGLLAVPGKSLETATPGEDGVGNLDENGIPVAIDGYERLPKNKTVAIISKLGEIDFGKSPRRRAHPFNAGSRGAKAEIPLR